MRGLFSVTVPVCPLADPRMKGMGQACRGSEAKQVN